MNARRAILVTGAPRTGTTLVGEILGFASRMGVIFEPFHPDAGLDGVQAAYRRLAQVDYMRLEFPYVSADHPLAETFRFMFCGALTGRAAYMRPSYRGRWGLATDCVRRVLTSRLAMRNRFAAAWPFYRQFVVKDPHLCLASEFVHRETGSDCVVIIRHPAATAESWARLGWNPDLRQFWVQPLLWERYLAGFPRPEPDVSCPLENAAYAWLYIHEVLLRFRERNPNMLFVRLEDIAARPVEEFRALYARLGLTFDRRVEQAVMRHTMAASNEVGTSVRPHRLRRNSRSVISGWKARLSDADQALVRRITGDTGARLYPEFCI